MQGISKECYVLIERLPEHLIKESLLKDDKQYEIFSRETLKFDEIIKEEHDDLNDDIYKANVSEVFSH